MAGRRTALEVDRLSGPRWSAALAALRDGHLIGVRNFHLGLDWEGPRKPGPDSKLVVEIPIPTWWKGTMPPEGHAQLSEAIANAGDLIKELEVNTEFRSLLEPREVQIELVRDYGTGATSAGRVREDGTVEWVE